jgi:glycogen synthase
MRQADAVVTVSQNIADTLANDGIDPRKLRVVRRGVDRAVFAPGDRVTARRGLGLPESGNVFIAVGRLVPVKGHSDLLQACRLLAARRVSFQCHLIGDGPLKGELQRQIMQLGLSNVVHLQGAQTQSELVEWYRAANLTVLPSLSEGVPNVLMESMACGTPFVASDVGGVAEIADSRHDRLVPPASPVALADAIEWQLKIRAASLPPRGFEPLAMKAAAQRLTRVLEDVRCLTATVAANWTSFDHPEAVSALAGVSTRVEAARCMQNSLPATSLAITQPVMSPVDETDRYADPHWHEKLNLPSTDFFADELGRTGEEFVLGRNPSK